MPTRKVTKKPGTVTRKPGTAPAARSAGSETAKTTARSTVSGPTTNAPPPPPADAASAKLAGTEAVAASFPFNAAKPSEFGRASAQPAIGQSVEPPHPMVAGSTLTEINASEKVGRGNPQVSFNPTNGPLDRVRVDSGGRALTTNQGVAIADNQNSLKAGLRGPALLEDFILREKITHFDHERIPERIVHARGSGAHGYFECYEPLARSHARVDLRGSRQAHAGIRPLLHRGRRARIHRHRARRARLRRQVLHRRGQLGSRGQQHPGVLHPGRDEVPRPHPRGQAGAASRDAAGCVRARHVLGLRVADARIDAHAHVGDVGSRHSAQLPHDAGIRRAYVPLRERTRRVAVREVPLESRGRDAFPRVGRGREDLRCRFRLPPARPVGGDRGRRLS